MFNLFVGILLGIWLDQTFTIPPLNDYIQALGEQYKKHYATDKEVIFSLYLSHKKLPSMFNLIRCWILYSQGTRLFLKRLIKIPYSFFNKMK